jgi:hypothetical protein
MRLARYQCTAARALAEKIFGLGRSAGPDRAQRPRLCREESGIPMQVVVPSVSRADLLQGTAFTLAVEATSVPALPCPALAF